MGSRGEMTKTLTYIMAWHVQQLSCIHIQGFKEISFCMEPYCRILTNNTPAPSPMMMDARFFGFVDSLKAIIPSCKQKEGVRH